MPSSDKSQQHDEKFFFHMNVFDEDEEDVEEEAPPPPVYSQEDLDAAKQEAYNKGHADATAESKASRSQAVAETLERISEATQDLFAQEHIRETAYEREAVALCLSIFKKLFPVYNREHGFAEMQEQIETVLQSSHGEQSIKIRVLPDYAEGIEKFMGKLQEAHNALSFSVEADETLSPGSVSLTWEDGGAIRDTETMSEQILSKLEELLAGKPSKRHDESISEGQPPADIKNPDEENPIVEDHDE